MALGTLAFYKHLVGSGLQDTTVEKMKLLFFKDLTAFYLWLIENDTVLFIHGKHQTLKSAVDTHKNVYKGDIRDLYFSFLKKMSNLEFVNLYSHFCKQYLRMRERTGEFTTYQNTQDRIDVITTHHIEPRFNGGTEDPNNKVACNYYLHGIAHLFRYFSSGKTQDVNGVNNGLRTLEEIRVANANRRSGQANALQGRPIGRPFTSESLQARRRPVPSINQRNVNRMVGTANQRVNSASQANVFTRFAISLGILWAHLPQGSTAPNEEIRILLPRGMENYTIQNHIAQLNRESRSGVSAAVEHYHLFSMLFKDMAKKKYSWYIVNIALDCDRIEASREISYTVTYTLEEIYLIYCFITLQEIDMTESSVNTFKTKFPAANTSCIQYVLDFNEAYCRVYHFTMERIRSNVREKKGPVSDPS